MTTYEQNLEKTTREFNVRVEARLAFASRRRWLLEAWIEAAWLPGVRAEFAASMRSCNDAEIAMLGGSY